MAATQKVINKALHETKKVLLNKSLKPIFPLPYLKHAKEMDECYVLDNIKDEIFVNNMNNKSGCSCRCIWCGWPQDQKM